VLDAALETFRARGYSGTSLEDLTAATGLNRPSLYGAFGNKQALFEACIDRYWTRVRQRFGAALRSTGALRSDLLAFFAAYFDVIYGGEATGCLVVSALPAEVEREPSLRPHLASVLAQSDAALGDRLEQARRAGELPARADPARLAGVIATAVMGLSVRARAGARRAELEALAQQLVELVEHGARRRRR
jgi:AcrR family transcriptional regulator